MTLSVFYIYSIVVTFVYTILYLSDYNTPVSNWTCLILTILQIVMYIKQGLRNNRQLYANWINPSNLVLIALLIVNFQTIINVLVGYDDFSAYVRSGNADSYLGSLTCLSALSIDAYLVGLTFRTRQKETTPKEDNFQWVWPWLVVVVGLFIWFYNCITVEEFLTGESYEGSGASNREAQSSAFPERLLNIAFIIYITLASIKMRRKQIQGLTEYLFGINIIFWIVCGLYLILRLASGDRGPVIYNIILIFYGYILATGKHLKLRTLLILVIVGALGVTIVGKARQNVASSNFSDRLSEGYEDVLTSDNDRGSIFMPTQELANSVNCNYIAVKDIQTEQTEIKWGQYTLFGIVTSIPGSYSLCKHIGIDAREYLSAEYITISRFGHKYFYGLGTTTFAEFYLDLGYFGILFGFLLLGYVFRRVDLILIKPYAYSAYFNIFAMSLASIAIYIPRFSLGQGLGKAFYTLIIYFIFRIFFKVLRLK